MRNFVYLVSGLLFGFGLCLSGMIDSQKVKDFLAFGSSNWNPALIFVLAPAVCVYGLVYWILRKKNKIPASAPKPTDRKLVLGAIIFGIGWGLIGVCPGPALVHIAFPDLHFTIFITAMFLGFSFEKRFQ